MRNNRKGQHVRWKPAHHGSRWNWQDHNFGDDAGSYRRVTAFILGLCKRNVEEAEGKFPSDCEVRTFNSCGHRIVAKMIGKKKLEVDKQKTNKLLRIIIDEANSNVGDVLWGTYHDVIPAVAHAKALGYVPDGSYTNAKRLMNREQFHQRLALDMEEPDELTAELIDTVLLQSIRTAFEGYID